LHGGNAVSMLKNLNIEKLVLVDPYLEYNEYKNSNSGFIYSQLVYDEIYREVIYRMRKYGNKVKIFREKSSDVQIDDKFDFIYLDGNYDYISDDFKKFYPMLNPGGIFGGYAFSGNHRRFVEELLFLVHQYGLVSNFCGDLNEWWIKL